MPLIASLINGEDGDSISVIDRGFAYGDGVFETIKLVDGQPCYWQLHLQRLLSGCERLQILLSDDFAETLLRDCNQLLAERQLPGLAILKIIVTRGPAERGYRLSSTSNPTRVMLLNSAVSPETHDQGVRLRLCQLRLSLQPALAGIKHLNRLEQVLARAEWQDDFQEGLLLNAAGAVIEGTMSNIFMVKNGCLKTPLLDEAGVAGIMRRRVISWAKEQGINIEICSLQLDEIKAADHLFLCNSFIGIWPVTEFDQKIYTIWSQHGQLSGWLNQDSLQSRLEFNH